jgi:predicted kinase
MDKKLYIVRGLPGSGKTTFAESLGGSHFEADQYFMVNGEYQFDFAKIKDAHNWCQNQVSNAMLLNYTANINKTIVVSNTFTQEWEMQPYIDMAKEWGYTVFTIIVENRHGGKNVHGVPDDKLEIMKNRFEIKL